MIMIYFIRHGESEANVQGVFAGQKNDSPLTEKGKKQAKEVGQKIKEKDIIIHKIISSPLIRTQQTAKIIADELGIDESLIFIDERITEYDMGDLTSTPIQDISSLKLLSAKHAEPIDHFKARLVSFLKEIYLYSENCLIVSHAGVGRLIETIKQDIKPELFYDLPAYINGDIIELSINKNLLV